MSIVDSYSGKLTFSCFQVQNAVDFLKMIGALDENENLTHLGQFYIYRYDVRADVSPCLIDYLFIFFFNTIGEYLAMLPLDPKLGKMLIMGAFFRCFDPILTIVAGLSVKDPFLLPQEKKDVSNI